MKHLHRSIENDLGLLEPFSVFWSLFLFSADFFDPTGFCRLNHSSDFFDPSAFFDSTSFFRHRRNEKKRNALVSEQAKLKIDLLSELYNKLPNANQANAIVSKNQPTETTVAADKSRRWTASKTPLIKSGGATNPSNSPHARDCSVVSNTAYEMNETPTQIDRKRFRAPGAFFCFQM